MSRRQQAGERHHETLEDLRPCEGAHAARRQHEAREQGKTNGRRPLALPHQFPNDGRGRLHTCNEHQGRRGEGHDGCRKPYRATEAQREEVSG